MSIQYACPLLPEGYFSVNFDETIPLVYSLTTMGSQSYQLDNINLYPTNCGYVIDGTTLTNEDNGLAATELSYDIPTYTLTKTHSFDPLALPSKHDTQEITRRIVTYFGSSSTIGHTW